MDALFGTSTGKVAATKPSTQLRIQSSIVGIAVPIVYGQTRIAGNLLDYQDFLATQNKSSGSGGKGGSVFGSSGKGGTSSVSYSYSAAVVIGLCEGPISAFGSVWTNKTKVTTAAVNFTGFLGGYSQSPWAYMTAHHPGNALNYRGLTYVAAGPIQLGATPELANFNFEITGFYNNAISGLPDADPRDVITDLLTNQYYGAGFPSANLAALTTYSQYCRATGMVISHAITSQQSVANILKQLTEGTNSDFRWSGSTLDIVPYGDTTITANGSTYTAPSAPQYDISEGDFLPNPGDRPVQFTRAAPSDQFNVIHVRYLDRLNDYNQVTVDSYDEAAIARYGRIEETPRDYSFFCDGAAAQLSAALRLGRQSVRLKYQFKVGRRFVRLDAMDIVSLTHLKLGLSAQWVRITEIQELDDGRFDITAEEYLNGTSNAPIYSRQLNSGYGANYNVASSSINTPIIFNPPQMLTNGNKEIWIAVSGSNQGTWGGCQVWVSTDDVTYRQVGTIVGSARQGVLYNSTYPSYDDPDTTNTCYVDLTMSRGALTAGTATDAARGNTACYVGGEIISYDTAPLQATYKYGLGLGGQTRRGIYGSACASHAVGTPFVRLDEQIFKLDFTKDHLGTVTYFKFTSFNRWGGAQETLAGVSSYTLTLTLPPRALYEHLDSANLLSHLQLSVEAGDSACYPSTTGPHALYWQDRSPNKHFMAFGDFGGSHRPAFNGTVGDKSYTTYMLMIDNNAPSDVGGMFIYNAGGTPAWAQTMHKAGGKFSIFAVCHLHQFNSLIVPFATLNGAGTAGMQFGYEWIGGGPGKIRLTIAGNAGGLTPTYFSGNDQDMALACSYDDGTGQSIIMCNGQTLANGQFGGNNTSAINTASDMTMGYYLQAPLATQAGCVFWTVQVWDCFLSQAALHDLYIRWRSDRVFPSNSAFNG